MDVSVASPRRRAGGKALKTQKWRIDMSDFDTLLLNSDSEDSELIWECINEIRNLKSNKLLDVVGSGITSGTNVNQWEYNGGHANQKWVIEKGAEAYKIRSKLNGLYLNLENGKGANNENVNVETGTNAKTQEFFIERIDEKSESGETRRDR